MNFRIHIMAYVLLITAFISSAQGKKDVPSILRDKLTKQQKSWNNGDLVQFMQGYWENDSLMFIGSGGITYGYDQTLEGYKSRYDSPEKMGKLSFDIYEIKKVSKDVYFMVGKFHLTRTIGDAEGIFTLLWKKINGEWVIVADHTG